MIDEVHAALQKEVDRVEAAGWPVGEHEVPGRGRIIVEELPSDVARGTSSMSFVQPATAAERAQRLLGPVRRAAKKFLEWRPPVNCLRLIVMDVPINYNPDEIYRALADDIRADAMKYRESDAVIVRRRAWDHPKDDDPARTYQYFACFALRLPSCTSSEADLLEFARCILASPHRLAAPIRRRGLPDPIPSAPNGMRLFGRTL